MTDMMKTDNLKNMLMNSSARELEKRDEIMELIELKGMPVNIMITGATGAGKSSTINAISGKETAKVGTGVDPETMKTSKYKVGSLSIWDTPGLGDTPEKDNEYARQIVDLLHKTDMDGYALIDLVIVVIDGSSRDMSASYNLINEVIIPSLGKKQRQRVLIAINQADMAMKGKHWDYTNNRPDEVLKEFLDRKADSVKKRIMESTGVTVEPVYYCAGYTDDDGKQNDPYNLSKLMGFIYDHFPEEKREVVREKPVKKAVKEVCYDDDDDEFFDLRGEISDLAADAAWNAMEAVDNVLEGGINLVEGIFEGIFSLF